MSWVKRGANESIWRIKEHNGSSICHSYMYHNNIVQNKWLVSLMYTIPQDKLSIIIVTMKITNKSCNKKITIKSIKKIFNKQKEKVNDMNQRSYLGKNI